MSYLPDSNILIYAYRGNTACRQQLARTDRGQLYLSAVVLFELEVGIRKSSNPAALRSFVQGVLARSTFLPLDAESASQAAQVRAQLESTGRPIGPYDLLIAGTALAHGLTLVTHNQREFARVPGLRLADWHEPSS
ncbi:MAG: type II toxin-antitoxin system VapC family toxin [Pseudomonadota bacterium]|nr:type II toxin-antitoxin system VapC family toxin [Pseudomonadota bacterium]